jgi:hypothetical protein
MGDGRWEMGDGRWEMGDGREKCILGVSPLDAPFQDSGVFIRGEPPNEKMTRQMGGFQ